MGEKIKIIGISGSLRRESYNTAALKTASGLLPENAELEIADISKIPFFNEDVEAQGEPAAVKELKEKISGADAVLIATPEYNYSISGVLKNTIDWLSRGETKPLAGMPLAIISASKGIFGGVRAQNHLRQICVILDAKPLNKPEVFIMSAHNKFDSEGKLKDDFTKDLITKLMAELVSEAEKAKV